MERELSLELPVWRFNGSSKGFAPARPQVVEQQTSGLAVLGSHEGKPSGLWGSVSHNLPHYS